MRVHEIFLLAALSVLGIGLAPGGQSVCPDNDGRCSLAPYFVPALHPGLNRALCLELPYLKPSEPQMVALFSSCENFANRSSYSDGYSCRYSSPAQNSNNCTRNSVIVECIDEHKTLPTGRAVLAIDMTATDISKAEAPACTAFVDISWTLTACIVEEFHEYPDQCSGIVDNATISGTNATWFAVNVSGIEVIGRAVLLSASSYFCGQETMNGSSGDTIQCEAELRNQSVSDTGTGADGYSALFRCPGDATIVPEGPAKIVFERNLTSNLSAECEMLTPSTPYTSDYSGFQIQWRHPDSTNPNPQPPGNGCEEVDTGNLDHCTAVCISTVNSSTDLIETCDKVVESILDDDGLTGDEFSRLLDILGALVVTPGVDYLDASLETIQYLVDALQDNLHVITDTSGRRLVGMLDEVLADEKQHEWMLLQEDDDEASQMLASVEGIGSLLGRSPAVDAGAFRYTGENILVLTVERVQPEDTLTGSYRFPKDANTSTMVEIPIQLLCDQSEDHSDGSRPTELDCPSIISSSLVRNLPGYLDQTVNRTGFKTNTAILATQVQNASNLEDQFTTHPVRLRFAPADMAFNFTNSSMCVFWNFTISNWSSNGLSTAVESRDSIVCTSTHLTSFAVLVDINGPQTTTEMEQFALKVVSYIGCSISLLCLTFAIFIFTVFGKYLNKGVLLHIHLNFAIALALSLLVFISGLETARNIKWLCTVVAALLHYLLTCVFCWMLAEGIMLYLLVVRVFGRAAEKWYYLLILGWGLPIPIVAISVGIRHQDYGTDDFCWLSTRSGTIWAFVGPMLFIILINSVILVLTIVSLVRGRKAGGAEPDVRTVQLVKTAVKSTIILLPLLGITWLFGLLAVNENTTVFAWVFTVCNSLQGFFFFVFHVLRNEKVCEALRKCFKCVVPVIGVDRQEIIKDMSNMGTADSLDGVETSRTNQDLEITRTQYHLHTFERSYSGTSQDSTTAFVGALNTI